MKHPIDLFIVAWAAVGGPDGLDVRLRVYKSLCLPGEWDRLRLRRTLRALLVHVASLEMRFDAEFDAFFSDEQLPGWLAARLDGQSPEGPNWSTPLAFDAIRVGLTRRPPEMPSVVPAPRSPPPSAPPPPSPRAPRAPAPSALAPPPPPAPRQPVAQRPAGQHEDSRMQGRVSWNVPKSAGLESDTPVKEGLDRAAPPGRTTLQRYPGQRAGQSQDGMPEHVAGQQGAASGQSSAAAKKLSSTSVSRTSNAPLALDLTELDFRSENPPIPFAPSEVRTLAYQTELVVDREHPMIDVRASVLNSARRGGIWQPVYRSWRKANHLVVGVPQDLDPIAEVLVDFFESGFRQHGVSVERRRAPPRDELLGAVLLVLDTSRSSLASLMEWLRLPNIALVEARDPALWGEEINRLPVGVHTLDSQGLTGALSAASSQRKPPPTRIQPRGAGLDRLGEALPLAAAIALAAPCDLATADEIRRELTPKLPFCRLQRIVALRGVTADPTGWRFSVALVGMLSQRTSPQFRARVLAWQKQRLGRLRPRPKSWAEVTLTRELELIEWQLTMVGAESSSAGEAALEKRLRDTLGRLKSHLDDPQAKRRLSERIREIAVSVPSAPVSPVMISRFTGLLDVEYGEPRLPSSPVAPAPRPAPAPTRGSTRSPEAATPVKTLDHKAPSTPAKPLVGEPVSANPEVPFESVSAEGAWKLIAVMHLRSGRMLSAAFSSSGSRVIGGASTGTAYIWDIEKRSARILEGHVGWVLCTAFGGSDGLAATGGADNAIIVWNVDQGSAIQRIVMPGTVYSVTFNPEGSRLAAGCGRGPITVYNVADMVVEPLLEIEDPGGPGWLVRFSPDGRYLLSSSGHSVTLWDATSGKPVAEAPHRVDGRCLAAAFSPDGESVILGGQRGRVVFWNLKEDRLEARALDHAGEISSIAFGLDGRRVITAGDRLLKIWEVATGRTVATLRTAQDIVDVRLGLWGARVILKETDPVSPFVVLDRADRYSRVFVGKPSAGCPVTVVQLADIPTG